MLTTLFVRPSVLARLEGGPAGPYVSALATVLHQQRYAPDTIRQYLRSVDAFSRWHHAQGRLLTELEDHHLAQYLVHVGRRPLQARPNGGSPHAAAALPHLLCVLRAQEGMKSQVAPPSLSPAELWLHRFITHLRDVRGLAPLTCQGYLFFVRRFLSESGRTSVWRPLQAEELSAFVRREAEKRRGGGRKRPGTALRAFVRFLVTYAEAPAGLEAIILTPCEWTHASVPPHFSQDEIAQMLAAATDGTPTGQRNHAILLLLARLGLRAQEVAQLQLADIAWTEGRLSIHSTKSHRVRHFPLPQEVGAAVATYLHQGRPASTHRAVFVHHRAPFGPFQSSSTIAKIVRWACTRAQLQTRASGAHALRHTAASRMVQRGVSFKTVADLLGHQSLQTTAIYAKLDLPALGAVALPWPGGAL